MKRTISMPLDPDSIGKAIEQIFSYRDELRQKCHKLIENLTEQGSQIARLQVAALGAVYTGELESSIDGYYNPATNCGFVRADAWYAVFVEYGTGVVGANSPHPDPKDWTYDANGHGDDGWWYFSDRDNQWHWTKGYESRPFMYNTVKELERLSQQIAAEVFGA